MKKQIIAIASLIILVLVNSEAAYAKKNAKQPAGIDRTVLPIQEPKPPFYTELDARNAKAPPRFEVKAPNSAPNVLLVLLDDLGFAGTSTFGGPVSTPTFEQIANEGVRYNNFHTTAVCSPTRAAIKSGRNHHVNNMGGSSKPEPRFPATPARFPTTSHPWLKCCV